MAGALVGVGLALLVWRLVPADPDLAETLERLSPERIRRRRAAQVVRHTGRQERLGVWAEGRLPSQVWVGAPPNEDLAILGVTRARFLGEKIVGAVIGLATPPLAVLLLTVVQGHAPSVALPNSPAHKALLLRHGEASLSAEEGIRGDQGLQYVLENGTWIRYSILWKSAAFSEK